MAPLGPMEMLHVVSRKGMELDPDPLVWSILTLMVGQSQLRFWWNCHGGPAATPKRCRQCNERRGLVDVGRLKKLEGRNVANQLIWLLFEGDIGQRPRSLLLIR